MLPHLHGTYIEPQPSITAVCTSRYLKFPPIRTEKSWIHEQLVCEYLSQVPPYSILEEPPPLIADSESSLLRESRVHLARRRSGHYPSLLAFQNRIDQITDPTCRYFGTGAETIHHLLEDCPPLSALRGAHGVQNASHIWDRTADTLEFFHSAGPF